MRNSPGRSHAAVRLSAPLDQRLNFYALAASAAGVSLLALAPPSEAKIIYTKTHQVIGTNGIYPLDLNHDGNIDFVILESGAPFSFSGGNALEVDEAFGNAMEGSKLLAAALKKGALIGPHQPFISNTSYFAIMFRASCSIEAGCSTVGQWGNVSNRFLGLKFQIKQKTHYGWARLSVEVQQDRNIVATLTGYAYETIENKGIHAGQTVSEADLAADEPNTAQSLGIDSAAAVAASASTTTQAASLGRLAFGARAVSLRSRP